MKGMGDDDVEQGQIVLAEAVRAYRDALAERLVAAYALGSLAHGGFSALVSDVDLGLIVADPPRSSDPEVIQRVAEIVKAGPSALHARLSVFWATPSALRGQLSGGRFPPLDRLDLIQHGVLVAGVDVCRDLPQPSRADLVVAGAEFALDFLAGIGAGSETTSAMGSMRPANRDTVEQLRQADLLVAQGVRRVTKLVLFPVRFLYTAETGLVGTNQSAAEHYLAQDGVPSTNLVAAALDWRSGAPDSAYAAALLHAEMVPLYLHYIDDHVERLAHLGRPDLAEAFVEWRRRIAA